MKKAKLGCLTDNGVRLFSHEMQTVNRLLEMGKDALSEDAGFGNGWSGMGDEESNSLIVYSFEEIDLCCVGSVGKLDF